MHSTASFGLRASFGFRNDKRNPRSLVELWVADSCVRLRFVTEGEKMSDFGLRFCDEAGDIERVSISLAVSIDSSSSEKGLPPQKERKLIPLNCPHACVLRSCARVQPRCRAPTERADPSAARDT